MALRKDNQSGCSWVPATPAKPDSTTQQLICNNRQENHHIQTNWFESERLSRVNQVTQTNWFEAGNLRGRFVAEGTSQTVPACHSSINSSNVDGGCFNTWQSGGAAKSHVYRDTLCNFDTWQTGKAADSNVYGEDFCINDKFTMNDAESMPNMSFGNLLALAQTGNPAETSFRHHFESSPTTINFGNSSTDLDNLLGERFQSELYRMPGIQNGGSSIPSRPFFDLNSPPKTITNAALGKSKPSQFEPITPEMANKVEHEQQSTMQGLSRDDAATAKDAKENAMTGDNVKGHNENKEQSQQVNDQLCATTSTQLQENHLPDKAGSEEADLIKTPQQKPRRRKHRPKVVIEGQTKRTPKPRAEKASTPQDTTRAKRKYIRRKGVDNPTNSPLEGETNGTDSNKKTFTSTDTPVGKRTYETRKGIDKLEDTMDKKRTTETIDLTAVRHTRSSCRRSLNFDLEAQVRDESFSYCPSPNCDVESRADNYSAKGQSSTTVQGRHGKEVMMEKNDMGIAYELTRSTNQVLQDYLSRPERHSSSPSPRTKTYPTHDDYWLSDKSVCTKGKCQIVFSDVTHDKEANNGQVTVNPGGQWTPKSPSGSLYSNTCLTQERQPRGLKRQHLGTSPEAETCSTNATGTYYNSMQKYLSLFSQNADSNGCTPGMYFPTIYKKKRSEKGSTTATSSRQYTMTGSDSRAELERRTHRDSFTQLFISRTNEGSTVAQCKATSMLTNNPISDCNQNGRQILEDLLALGPRDKIKKKRSKGPTRVRDLASLLKICKEIPVSSGKAAKTSKFKQEIQILHEPNTCMEALVADSRSTMMTKKRSKRSMLINMTGQNTYNHREFPSTSMGPPLAITWKSMSPIDSITQQLNRLDLNAASSQLSFQKQNELMAYHMYQEQNALVPYQRGGAVVPFDGSFDQIRRRRPRPKVDLDDETTRVWKLLLENINSEGIDGTDEEKTKWWEEERRVFNGRADSFIARMHLVQGDRRFSPWKGSVLDSVIGVFLTQNVSDHLSSSAYMSLAARFPLVSKTNPVELHEERVDTKIKEPEVCILDPDETSGMNKVLFEPLSVENDKLLHDFGDDAKDNLRGQLSDMLKQGPVMSHESAPNKSMTLVRDEQDMDDGLSSQTSVISSQNSVDSPIVQTTERTESCSASYSEEEALAEVKPNKLSSSASFVKLLQMAGTVLHGVYEKGGDKKECGVNWKVQSENLVLNSQDENNLDDPVKPIMSSTQAECLKYGKFSDTSSGKRLCTAEISGLSAESVSQTTFPKFTAVGSTEGLKFSSSITQSNNNGQIEINPETDQVPAQNLFQENGYNMQDIPDNAICTGSSSNIDSPRNSEPKEVNSNKNDPDYCTGKMVNGPKAKGGRTGKQKQNPVDWDGLRKQAQESGRKSERTANTMDSVDWDAVRCADVNEISQTIKERGMNNMLAERIKDFLNRLVRDHGSIDLEWLRDVPPDKAKEYLLSIRGLGLKSVECVRLLTLHHLAFPVDTNVGRIAVRLGWVPLQPLPESLQLHLLELYPVLESIQKYLWPRLCKLDQRTLYELHYQMITFGKVFCTKSKPNCNACPMRGECRHFASAFASARLALPAPEDKSIVSASENIAAGQNPTREMNTLQLPAPQANAMNTISRVGNSQPIIEEPATPEPIVEVPATPEPEYTQVTECDIENSFYEDPDEIPTIQLNMEQFAQNLQKVMQQHTELQEGDMSKALVALTADAASIPVPKLKNVSRLRTEHQVYELPDSHPLLEGLDKREPDDPSPYLLAIWTPGETVDSIEPPERRCSSQESGKLCTEETCLSCNSIRELKSQTVRGTLLIPCRTAMRGRFPLNGTYFQVNEVFSDHESSLTPMDVPREWLWNLPRRTVYFGTSIPTIFKGLTTEGIQYCFWRGFVCVRGFDRKIRAPRPLIARLHFPASKLSAKGKGKTDDY
ncbi:hypothetical protein ACJIZ3_021835 [Penstemon smallii]|uniref:HhH-GPD domain-containing protein n=1 Tax=Penstemon smallii TaxID=265156 RepID=A0ABD3SN77_9LAMI